MICDEEKSPPLSPAVKLEGIDLPLKISSTRS